MNIDLAPLRAVRVLCAVSGGADSMCMLHLLHTRGVELCAAHYEHGIRGEEALRDARFVERYCAENDIVCELGHGNVPEYAAVHGLGIEEAARRLRYEFLTETAEKLGCGLIATAHNADDNAETVIFNLARGTGSAGLRGIPARRGNIVRPLLGVTRAQIERYLAENSVPYVEDSSNLSDEFSRNLIRHRVVPTLREINPALSEALGRASKLMAQDDDCLDTMADMFLDASFDGVSVPLDRLNALHTAVSSRVIRKLADRTLTLEQVERVLELCRGTELCYYDLPGQRVRIEKGRLWLDGGEIKPLARRRLTVGETVLLPEAGLKVHSRETFFSKEINVLFKTYYFKCENIKGDIFITGRSPGDKYRPRGRGCTKSLKSLFAEKGYTAAMRELTPVLRDGQGILAVYGFGADERVTPRIGERVIEVVFEKI